MDVWQENVNVEKWVAERNGIMKIPNIPLLRVT